MDLNADVGEGRGPGPAGSDGPVLAVVTTVHVACGYHAGDPDTMRRTVALALEAGVVVGAHPSLPDRDGFGRRSMERSAAALRTDVLDQLETLEALVGSEGAVLRSVKAHGALYERIASDPDCAATVAGAVAEHRRDLFLVVPAGSQAADAAAAVGLRTVSEGFCDRTYRSDGSLTPRSEPGAVVDDPDEVARRALRLAEGGITAVDGTELLLLCDTLCVHGDSPGAARLAGAARRALEADGVGVRAYAVPSRV